MSGETLFIAGRYNKYLRNLSQSPWIDKDDIRIRDSVQELIENGLKKFLCFDKCVFSSSGREDVDVRMLGEGRPFVFKILNPFDDSKFNQDTMNQIQKYINSEYSGMIRVRDLQVVSKLSVSKNLKEGEENKNKQYRALCCCSRKITQEDIKKISAVTNLTIDQRTPIRVLHRRSLASRKKKIHDLHIEEVKIGDFDSIKPHNIDNVFALTLVTEAGTYIKEFVHGDFGRTEPSFSTLLGDCETDLMELDVMEIYLDWPPRLGKENIIVEKDVKDFQQEDEFYPTSKIQRTETMKSILKNTNDDPSATNLEELYTEALKCLKKAESMPRGDMRQDLYINSRRLFEQSMVLVESLQLFSENETIDDIATVNLKYILIPAYLAKILLSSEHTNNGRFDSLIRAKELVIQFFRRISRYNFNDDDKRIEDVLNCSESLKDEQDNDQLKSTTTTPHSLEFAMHSRAEKIENYKKMKELENKIIEFEKLINSGQEIDNEIYREYYLILIKKTISDCYESLMGEIKPAIFFERNRNSIREITENDDQPKPSSSGTKTTMPLKTFTILKDDLQKKAFGLGYPSRPTVTVDEFIDKKMKDGELAFQKQKEVYANSLQRYAEKPDLLRQQEELSDEERDLKEDRDDLEELNKKRRWDEFKDDNPRGSGNRHNMG